jgi:hypothetical protein
MAGWCDDLPAHTQRMSAKGVAQCSSGAQTGVWGERSVRPVITLQTLTAISASMHSHRPTNPKVHDDVLTLIPSTPISRQVQGAVREDEQLTMGGVASSSSVRAQRASTVRRVPEDSIQGRRPPFPNPSPSAATAPSAGLAVPKIAALPSRGVLPPSVAVVA